MEVDYALYTDKGKRDINEDGADVICVGKSFCFVLADGLGGHGRGDEASACAVQTAREVFSGSPADEAVIACIFEKAQERLLELQKEKHCPASMKTTLTVLTLTEDKLRWGHIGDSRIYRFRGRKLEERTRDHSVVQALATLGEIREKDIRNHPDRNRLLRVLGQEWTGESYEISGEMDTGGDDSFILCSDGFWEYIDERKMQKLLKKTGTAGEWLEAMKQIVFKNGKDKNMDNNTAITVRIRKN